MVHQGSLPSIMGSCLPIPYYILPSVAFTGKFSPNFDLKNMISTYTKIFVLKITQIRQFLNYFSQIDRFL
jgi:hypothetical protein